MNLNDTYRGVIHLCVPRTGGEYTLCGYAFDEPASEHDAEPMADTTSPCTCPDCIGIAKELLPYLKKEIRKITSKEGGAK